MGQRQNNSCLLLFVYFLLGAVVTFTVLRLVDVYGFQLPLNTGSWDPSVHPGDPPPAPRPSPVTYDTPRPEPVTYRPASTSPPRPSSTEAPVTEPPSTNRRVIDMHLPRDIWPKHYNLSLQIFLPGYGASISPELKYHFTGHVTVTFENKKPVKKIVLNQRNLAINQSKLTTEAGKTLTIKNVKSDNRLEFVFFELNEELPPGTHQLYVKYKGNMKNNEEQGLYLSRDSPSRPNLYIAVTQMEPFDARTMAPCLDEPEYKAVWKMSITHPKKSIALANEIELSAKEMGDWKTTSFGETPVMSSYLVAIFVGNYSYVEDHTAQGLRIRVYAPAELVHHTKWALKVAVKAMNTFEKLFKIPYPMKKLDLIYVWDFAAGAMENWGLVTFKAKALLYLNDGDWVQKKEVAHVVAHELAHQWFGNLVTTAWWSQLWLNEGWATFHEFTGAEEALNSSIPAYQYYLDAIRKGMNTDRYRGRPLTYEMEYQEEIERMFDGISYDKGAAVIAMLKDLLGPKIFDQAVKNYLKKYQYKNTRQTDLFREFDALIPADKLGPDGKRFNVTDFAFQYTLQKGIPMVTLMPHNETHSRIVQQMLANKKKNPRYESTPYGFKWDVPISVQRGEHGREFYWMLAGQDLFIPSSANETLLVNADSFVYSVVNYTEPQWITIAKSLNKNHTMFSEQARAKLMDDISQADIYLQLYPILFDVYPFKNENDYLPFATFLKNCKKMEDQYGQQVKNSVAKFLKTGLEARVKAMDIRETTRRIVDLNTYHKERLSLLLYAEYCRLAPGECQNDLAEIFMDDFLSKCQDDQMASKCSTVPVELRKQVYCAGVKSGGDKVVKTITRMRNIEQWEDESERLFTATFCSTDKKVVWKSIASLGIKEPTKTASLVVDNKLGSQIVADYTIDTFLEEKPIHEKKARSQRRASRKYRQFGSNETMEKMRKAISRAVDQKTMEGVDGERGRRLAKALDEKTRQLISL